SYGVGAGRMGRPDLPVPTNLVGDGPRVGDHLVVQGGIRTIAVPPAGSGRTDGVLELHYAVSHLYAVFLRLRVELLCGAGFLPDLLCRSCDLGVATDRQSPVVEVFPFWTSRVALAKFDLLAASALRATASDMCLIYL